MIMKQPETKNELYQLIQNEQSKEEFEKEVKELQHEFGDLIDEHAAAFLIVDKLGYNQANVMKLAEVHAGQEATVEGVITHIDALRTFTRKNGRIGKVVNMLLTDETGTLPIVFWNDDAQRVSDGEYRLDMKLKIINGYTKQGRQGVELHVGRWSTISIEPKSTEDESILKQSKTIKSSQNKARCLKGTVLSISPTSVFLKKDETYGFVCKVHVKTTKGIKYVTVWDDQVKTLQEFSKGDTIEFSYLDVKEANGTEEFHANGKAMISTC